MKIDEISFVKSAETLNQMPSEAFPEVAFIGRSNVGKSSLLNMLCQRKSLARTSSTPGKTQTFNFYKVNHEIYFVDVPGYGYAKISKKARAHWRRTIAAYLTQRDSLCAVLHLVDSRHPPTELDEEVMRLLHSTPAQCFLVLTKADKLSGNSIIKSMNTTRKILATCGTELPIIITSARERKGRQDLLERISASIFPHFAPILQSNINDGNT